MKFVFEQLSGYITDGGAIIIPMIFLSFIMWSLIVLRYLKLNQLSQVLHIDWIQRKLESFSGSLQADAKNSLNQDYAKQFSKEVNIELAQYKGVINSIVLVAPLIGLLGTVMGMIETFQSLESMSLHSQSGGIAGGISQALITTQMGLIIAIPGMFFHKLLAKKETKIKSYFEMNVLELIGEKNQ